MNSARKLIGSICFGLLSCSFSQAEIKVDSGEFAFETMNSDLITLLQGTVRLTEESGKWTTSVTASYSDYDVDYEPATFDFRGLPTKVSESTTALSISVRKQMDERTSLILGAGLRDGFSNYRSLWLDTYFDQQFASLDDVPGSELYEDFKPEAMSITGGFRYEYQPSSGILQFVASQIQDEVSPGFEIDFDGLRRSSLTLATSVLDVSTENVLTPRIRTRWNLRASKTSERSWRYSSEFSANVALGQNWIWRTRLGASTEDPLFEAFYADTAVEYEISEKLSLYLDTRYYKDNGEIENALLFTTASPGLVSNRLGIGLRYASDNWSGRLYVSTIESDYETTNLLTDFFQNLYRDRDWTNIQLAIGRTF